MPIPEGAVQTLQQEKPATYDALESFITALAALPMEDAEVASMLQQMTSTFGQGAGAPAAPEPLPMAPNNVTSQPFDAAAEQSKMQSLY